jgi:Lrp/AsnC family transcriptional regulator, regulator for asnA, asnC and gidA
LPATSPNIRSANPSEDPLVAGHSADALDIKILNLLLGNARCSAREIGARLGVSTSTVISRMEALQKAGILRGFAAEIDYEKLGYGLTVITEILVSKGKLLELEEEISKIHGVCAVYDVTGETDAIVISKCRNREELSRFTKSLLSMHFVERTNSHIVLTTVKEDFRLRMQA